MRLPTWAYATESVLNRKLTADIGAESVGFSRDSLASSEDNMNLTAHDQILRTGKHRHARRCLNTGPIRCWNLRCGGVTRWSLLTIAAVFLEGFLN